MTSPMNTDRNTLRKTEKKSATMKNEVHCACEFMSRMLQAKHLPVQFIKSFRSRLEEVLIERYKNHWDPENPQRGSAYRCIRINGRMDPIVKEAAKVTGLTDIGRYLPAELTLWVDPNEVSYRFGEDGSICQCAIENNTSTTATVESEWHSSATQTRTSESSSNYYVKQMYSMASPYAIPVHV